MKKARFNFQFQYMYIQNYIPSYTKKTKDQSIRHTPGHNPYMEKKNQMLSEKAPAEELDKHNQEQLQKIVGKFLYYNRAIYLTMLMVLKSVVVVLTKLTIKTAK